MEEKFIDKILICIECKEEFVFTASAQEYFAGRGFMDDPKRCKSCYLELKKAKRRSEREMTVRGHFEAEVPVAEFSLASDDLPNGNSREESDLD
jgi:hypothetical protein